MGSSKYVCRRFAGWLGCLVAAGAMLSGMGTYAETVVTGTVVINSGATTTASRSVTLTLDATSSAAVLSTMSFSDDGATWTTPESYAASRAYVLPPVNGDKTVWVKFADTLTNESVPVSATIALNVPPLVLPGLVQTGAVATRTLYQGSATNVNVLAYVTDPAFERVLVKTTLGDIPLRLYQYQAPLNVANFLRYVGDGKYDGSFFHRLVAGFVLQGGGYAPAGTGVDHITTYGPVNNEFGVSNTRGTVAMAKTAEGPNSATSEWFVSLADNSANLDYQNGGFTVFGEVQTGGMSVVDAIAALEVVNLGDPYASLPVTQVRTSVQLSDLVYINTATVQADDLTPAVVSAPPGVGAAIASGSLVCTPAADAPLGAGTVHLSITAFDGRTLALAVPVTVEAPDTVAPAGTVVINGGAATTVSVSVTLTLSATDDRSGVAFMRFSTDNATWGDWQAYAATAAFTLPAGAGDKTVYAQFKDAVGNISASASDAITRPEVVTGTLLINGGAATTTSRSVTLTLSATSLAGDIDTMSFSADGTTWSTATTYATSAPFVLTPGDGAKTVWVRFADKLANVSPAIPASITLAVPALVLPALQQTLAVTRQSLYQGSTNEISLSGYVTDPAYKRVLLKTTLGDVQLRLYQAQTPLTVANFLRYVADARYAGTFFHRLVAGFVLQGGGYLPDNSGNVTAVTTYGPVQNEFGVSNTRGTVAMAKLGTDPNSATCEFFFNLADNSANLDYQNGGFTAFGEVLAPGMTVVDVISALPVADMGDPWSALPVKQLSAEVPLSDLIYIDTATLQADELTFAVTGSPAGITASIQSGKLVCVVAAGAALGDGTVTLNVTAFDGRALPLTVPVTVLAPDLTAPSGTMLINGGAATTNNLNVTLTFNATDTESGVAAMRLSSDNTTWSDWLTYVTSYDVTLGAGIGVQTIYAQFKDGAGNTSAAVSASITVPGPVTGTVVINGGAATATSRSVTLALTAATSATTAGAAATIDAMFFSNDGTTWSSSVTFAATYPFVLPPGNGAKTVWVVFHDSAGNQSLPLSASITLAVPATVVPDLQKVASPARRTIYQGGTTNGPIADYVSDPAYKRVLLQTSLGDVLLRLFQSEAPLTVANFLRYVQDGKYAGTFFHRSLAGFVVQGGGYRLGSDGTEHLTTYAPVANEFGRSNLRGTLAMAKTDGDPNSATSEWFFSLADNSANLDYQNGGFTVFGEVAGSGMTVVDAIAALTVTHLSDAFPDLPVQAVHDPVQVADLVYITTAAVQPDDLAFTVTSAPPGVTVTLLNGRLVYTVAADAPLGDGTVTLTATAPDGRTIDLTAPITVNLGDTLAPTGTVTINGGAATTTNVNATLTLNVTDNQSGVAEMRLSWDNTAWSDWLPYAATYAVTLADGIGVQTIYAQFKDTAGNVSASVSDSITVPGPVTGTIQINGGAVTATNRSVTLTFTATTTGTTASAAATVDAMFLSNDGTTWSASQAFPATQPYVVPYVLPPGNGDKTVWVVFHDTASNQSVPISATITLAVPAVVLPALQKAEPTTPRQLYQGGTSDVPVASYASDPAYERVLLQTTLGDVQLRLFQAEAPLTVANFLNYVQNGKYAGTFFHRALTDFVVQGGGYKQGTDGAEHIATYAAVANEFGRSNLRATLAMAKTDGDRNSATSEWFFSLADNSANLDYQNGGFTVFGEVQSSGMTVVDAIAALPRADLGGSFTDLPSKVVGTGTDGGDSVQFSDLIYINSATVQPDDLTFTVTSAPAGVTATMQNGRLVCAVAAGAPLGDGTVTLTVTAPDGRTEALAIPVTVGLPDSVAPSGTIKINDGAATTTTTAVTLTLAATDAGTGVMAMRFSTDNATWGDWVTYATTYAFTLPSGFGAKTVYVQFKDDAGNASAPVSASIDLPGVTASMVINGGAATTTTRSVLLTLTATSSSGDMYAMRVSKDGTTWEDWEYFATTRAYVLTPGDGAKTVYAQVADIDWNVADTLSASITLAQAPVVIPNPAVRFADQKVTLFYTGSAILNLLEYVNDPAYKQALFKTTKGDIPLRLFASRAPQTVANFLRYIDNAKYDNTLIHRSVSGFAVQGGGFFFDKSKRVADIATFGPVSNEFGASNLRGTLAMAKVGGDANSATCEWFVNLADNSANLDYQNGGFTVFGDTSDMTAVSAIAALQTINAGDPFTNLPVVAFDGQNIFLNNLVYLISATRQPDKLTFALSGSIPGVTAVIANGQLTLRATGAVQSATGAFSLHVTAPDGRAVDLPVSVVVSANHPPVIGNGAATQTVQCTEDKPVKITLSAKDADRDALTWAILEQSQYGVTTLLPPASATATSRTFNYVPTANAWGPDRFVVRVTDSKGGMASLIVKLVVKPVNDAPALTGLPAGVTVQAGESKTVPFTLVDPDSSLWTSTITCVASDKALFPTAQSMGIGGQGSSHYLYLAPAFTTKASTVVTLTLTVSDGTAKVVYKLPVTVTAARVPVKLALEPAGSQMQPGAAKQFALVATHSNGDVVTLTPGIYKLTAKATAGSVAVSAASVVTIGTITPVGAVVQVSTTYAGKSATAVIAVAGTVATEKYVVVDISGGPDATTYSHTTLTAVPTGGWTDDYKTNKVVLRLVPAGTAIVGSPTRETGRSPDEAQFQATLTKAFYIGVFEITQKQWLKVMGGTVPAAFATAGDTRPVESVSWTTVRGGTWPGGTAAAESFLGRLAQKAGLAIDLPTAVQWEYACSAGLATALYNGKSIGTKSPDPTLALLGHHAAAATVGTLPVGGLLPNAWGLYDMLGNVGEWCLDWYGAYPTGVVSDYAGLANGQSTSRVARGGAWSDAAKNCRAASRAALAPDGTAATSATGFRIASTIDGI